MPMFDGITDSNVKIAMESRFAHLRQRDNSVSMLRVKMSRRRSQSQKENRHQVVNSRRQLDKLPELDCSSHNASVMTVNMSTVQEKPSNITKLSKNEAAIERMGRLERWKEKKVLQKEKENRAKQIKGVFKAGLYQPKDSQFFVPLPSVPTARTRVKETTVKTAQNTRVTRSAKQLQHKPPMEQEQSKAVRKVEPAVGRTTRSRAAVVQLPPARATTRGKVAIVVPMVQAPSTRSANKPPVAAVPTAKEKPADARATRSRINVNQGVPPSSRGKNHKVALGAKVQPAMLKEPETKEPEHRACPLSPTPSIEKEEKMVEDPAPADTVPSEDPVAPPSFAPQGFVFQAPAGLSSFKPEPLTPRSADAFLTPSPNFSLPPVPIFGLEPQTEVSGPSPPKSPHRSPPRPSPTLDPPAPASPLEPEHDVPYFRSEVTSQTDGLSSLCHQWESRVEDESIPEEMRERMRTAIGQARLLMKERFAQFIGLVDDCDLGRGEKITTCTDLQGFWDMVYYQVEDVNKKFDALKKAETRGWVEELKPPPRQRKIVKKPPSTAVPKPAGTNVAAKSRLAALKAAMKARQQATEAEKAAQAAGNNTREDSAVAPAPQDAQAQAEPKASDAVVFQGGFFQVESPAKLPGSMRKSSRLSVAVRPQASPCSSLTKLTTPGRVTRRSAALSHSSPLPPAQPTHTLTCLSVSVRPQASPCSSLTKLTTPGRVTRQSAALSHSSPLPPVQPTHTPTRLTLTLTPAQSPSLRPKSQPSTPQSSQSSKDTAKVSLCFSPIQESPSDNMKPEESPIKHPEPVSRQDDVSPDCQEPKEYECVTVPEVTSPVTTQPPPSSPSVQHREGAAQASSASLPLSQELPFSPHLPLSPSSHAIESSAALSFTMSPCQARTTPARPTATDTSLPFLSSPYVLPSLPPLVLAPVLAEDSMVRTPDTSVTEGVPGLDIERYLQPSEQYSLSPRESTTEMLSPMATDVEMESPIAQPWDLLTREEEIMTPRALPGLPLVSTPQTPQTAESDLLLFAPDLTGKIRQSVCPSDLMVFTPPSNR